MNNSKDGGLVNRPPVLDDTSYDYWKKKMITFLKSIDNKTWKAVVKGWKHQVITFHDGSTNLELEAGWSKDEDDETLENDKALDDIFNGVDKNMFRLINTYTVAK